MNSFNNSVSPKIYGWWILTPFFWRSNELACMLLVINDELRWPNFLLLANCVSLSLPAKFSTTQLLTLFFFALQFWVHFHINNTQTFFGRKHLFNPVTIIWLLFFILAPISPAVLSVTNKRISTSTVVIQLWPAEQRNGPIRWITHHVGDLQTMILTKITVLLWLYTCRHHWRETWIFKFCSSHPCRPLL